MWKCGIIFNVGKTFSLFSKTKPTLLLVLGNNESSASNILFGPWSCGTRIFLFLSWESFFLSVCYSVYFTNAATPNPSTCLTVPSLHYHCVWYIKKGCAIFWKTQLLQLYHAKLSVKEISIADSGNVAKIELSSALHSFSVT